MKSRDLAHICMATLTASLLAACGGDDGPNHVETPMPAAGGGVHEGSIKGELNVFAIDDDTGAPITNASVRIEAAEGEPMTGQTDATGLFVAKDDRLDGAQTVTVVASGYRTSTWMGANGAVVTIPLASDTEAPVDTATASGTIEGWDDLPTPTGNHVTIAFVAYSFTDDLGDPANSIAQPGGGAGLPPNACLKGSPGGIPVGGPCNWSLVTRTGAQSHYALIIDDDTKGTFDDQSDDTMVLIGFAIKTGIDLNDGQSSSGESLVMLAGGPVDLAVTFPQAPAGLSTMAAIPLVRLGDELFPVAFPGLTPDATSTKVPPLSGALASGQYDLFVQAKASETAEQPSSFKLLHDVDISGNVAIGDFLPLPGGLSASSGTYTFTKVAGANLHVASFVDSGGDAVWNVALLDGRESFTLPALVPDGLPTGELEFHVSAIVIPDFSPTDFDIDDFIDTLDKSSEGFVTFTH
jgi:hypothetical protein